MSGSSLNLKQVFGGAAIKQGDTNTRLGYELLDKNSGPMYGDTKDLFPDPIFLGDGGFELTVYIKDEVPNENI